MYLALLEPMFRNVPEILRVSSDILINLVITPSMYVGDRRPGRASKLNLPTIFNTRDQLIFGTISQVEISTFGKLTC